ncbi:PCMD domain-containing protein [Chitinophagaceae bacterium 26-R-25]|nr:PCMD domain-containing protein [Chitinophagaceae bacterium 26-R-25]
MIKLIRQLSICFLGIALCYGCIKSAPLSPEADIETFTIDSNYLDVNKITIDQINRTILLYIKGDSVNRPIKPVITTTKGASVSPASGIPVVFNQPVEYTVTSEDGQNHKKYTVKAVAVTGLDYEFESWTQSGSGTRVYEHPVEVNNGVAEPIWSSGNPGLTIVTDPPYPTQKTTDSYEGQYAAEITTMPGTVLFGLGAPLAAGSLFLGSFDLDLTQPLKSTKFGQPFAKAKKPVRFTGYYKYAPGPAYSQFSIVNGKITSTPISGAQDSCAIYVVVFRGSDPLDGTNVSTSPRIIARAEMKQGLPASGYTAFNIPFEYYDDHIDWKNENLLFTVVFSSSKGGNEYRGALNSQLKVDHVAVVCEDVQ